MSVIEDISLRQLSGQYPLSTSVVMVTVWDRTPHLYPVSSVTAFPPSPQSLTNPSVRVNFQHTRGMISDFLLCTIIESVIIIIISPAEMKPIISHLVLLIAKHFL